MITCLGREHLRLPIGFMVAVIGFEYVVGRIMLVSVHAIVIEKIRVVVVVVIGIRKYRLAPGIRLTSASLQLIKLGKEAIVHCA